MGQYSDMATKVRRFRDNLEDEHESATKDAMETVQTELRAALRMNDSVARPVLIHDIREGEHPTDPQMVSRRVHLPEWAKYLEHGTGIFSDDGYPPPSNPPFESIRTWFIRKNLTPDKYDSVDSASAAIAEQIATIGNERHPFIGPTWDGPFGKSAVVDANKLAIRRAARRSF